MSAIYPKFCGNDGNKGNDGIKKRPVTPDEFLSLGPAMAHEPSHKDTYVSSQGDIVPPATVVKSASLPDLLKEVDQLVLSLKTKTEKTVK